MESKKPVLSNLGSTSFADAVALAEQLVEVMESMVGYRFYQTDNELVLFYLKRKICGLIEKLKMFRVIDTYKCDIEDLLALSIVQNGSFNVLLVYYRRKADHADWHMHEFSFHEDELKRCKNIQDYYVLCKVIKKKKPSSKMGEQHGAPIVEEDSENDDNILDFDVNSFGDDEGTPMDVPLGGDPSNDVDDTHDQLLSILHVPVPSPTLFSIPELHVDAYFMMPQVAHDHVQDAEGEVLPEPEPEPEPPRNALPNGNGGQPQEAPRANHPLANIHIENFQLEWGDFLELDDLLVPLPAPPNVEAPRQNVGVEMVENNVLLMIDPMLIPRMPFVPEGAHNDHEDEDSEDGEVDDNVDVWPEQDVISHSYENFPTSDTESDNSVLQPNQEAEVQPHGGGENNVLDPAENSRVSQLTIEVASSENEDGGASS